MRLTTLLLLLSTWSMYGQNIRLHEAANLTTDQFFDLQSAEMGTTVDDDWVLINATTNQLGSHLRYQQYHNDIPVVGAQYILHAVQGVVRKSNGVVASEIDVDLSPHIPTKGLASLAELAYSKPVEVTDASLVIIDQAFPHESGTYRLAYEVQIHDHDEHLHETAYIDATDGRLLYQYSNICYHSVPGSGKSLYYGDVDIRVDSIGPSDYLLHDPTRGNDGIRIFNDNDNRSEYSSTSPRFDLENADRDQVAIDVMHCTASFYDMMLDRFNWAGLDGNGLSMNSIVHINEGAPFVNAYWNGEFAHFGDGDCHNGPLTTMMITAHEFMHGVTDYTSNLIYADESGGLNEAMSDIFGKYAQYLYAPDGFDWTVDTTMVRSTLGAAFRNMADPNSKGNPSYYHGRYWQPGGSVHNNSGVLNYWFYLLSEGSSGTNESGYNYNVQAIGIDEAALITWLCQSSYLTSGSTYQDMLDASLAVTEDMFGPDSDEVAAVTEAWLAVGMSDSGSDPIEDLQIRVLTDRYTCSTVGQLAVEVIITNVGTIEIPADELMEVQVQANQGSSELFLIELDRPMQAGDTIQRTLQDAIAISDELAQTTFWNVELLYNDDNDGNNEITYVNSNGVKEELDLQVLEGSIAQTACGSIEYSIEVVVSNISCQFLFIDRDLSLDLYDIGGAYIGNAPVAFADNVIIIPPTQSSTVRTTTDLLTAPSQVGRIELRYPPDVSSSNNITADISYVNQLAATDGRISVDFEDQFGQPEEWQGQEFSVENFDGSNMLIASSGLSFDIDFLDLCDDLSYVLNDNILSQFGVVSTTTCLDLRDLEDIDLSFDLIQYRTIVGADIPEYEDLTTFTAITWEVDGDAVTSYVYGQEEGVRLNNRIALPSQYQGPLTIQLFSKVGSTMWPPLDGDCQMIDNIEIVATIVSSSDPIKEVVWQLSPNPTDGILYITNKDINASSYTIYGIDGRQVAGGNAVSQAIDMTTLAPGIYILDLISTNGQRGVQRIIKQ